MYYIYPNNTAVPLLNKDAFYQYIAGHPDLSPDQFYNNPFGVSSQEINGLVYTPQYANPIDTSSSSGTGGGSGGTSSAPTVDPATAAFLGNQISNVNTQIGALDPQLQMGLDNIQNSYNAGLNKENTAYGQAERNYNTNKTNTIQDELTAKNNIDTGVRTNTNSLQRLLGLAGSGNSSASQVLAPFAANRAGNQQRTQVQTSYGRNLQGLDTAWGDTQGSHQGNLTDLGNQNFSNQNSLKSSIANTRAGLLQTLAGLTLQRDQAAGKTLAQAQSEAQPFLNQVNDIVKGTAALGAQYQNPITLNAPSVYKAPDLASYNYGSTGAPTTPTSGGGQLDNTTFSPLFGTPQRKNLLGV